jgi:hypothetical protein
MYFNIRTPYIHLFQEKLLKPKYGSNRQSVKQHVTSLNIYGTPNKFMPSFSHVWSLASTIHDNKVK